MPNHWPFVFWPEGDGDLSKFMQRMANMHTQRWQRANLRVGYGHLYQGRFKSFPLEDDEHFYPVVRYVERNALRAGLVRGRRDLSRKLCTNLRGKHAAHSWPICPCRNGSIGMNMSTRLRQKPSLRPSADASIAGVRMAIVPGPNRRPSNLVCNQRFVAAVARTRAARKSAISRRYPVYAPDTITAAC